MRRLRWISGIVWVLSWRTIYLEIFRWRHMTKSLRFNPPPPLPGTNIQPRAGLPLIAVCVSSVLAPLVFVTASFVERTGRDMSTSDTSHSGSTMPRSTSGEVRDVHASLRTSRATPRR